MIRPLDRDDLDQQLNTAIKPASYVWTRFPIIKEWSIKPFDSARFTAMTAITHMISKIESINQFELESVTATSQ